MERRASSDQEGRSIMGRPPLGAELVDGLPRGSKVARRRLAVILRTLSGELTIEGASAELGVGRSRFHAMRTRFLSEATGLLEPRPPGPRAHEPTEAELEAQRLRERVKDLEVEVHIARVREDLAMTMPQRLKPAPAPGSAPGTSSAKKNFKTRRRPGR
jgi:hypothetical protein